jgi:inosine/xanthosine triphosphate pyrophosphatase family protein
LIDNFLSLFLFSFQFFFFFPSIQQAESLDKHTLADEFLADFGDEEQGNQVEENTMELEEAEDMELESTIQKINSVREIVKLCESAQLDSLIQVRSTKLFPSSYSLFFSNADSLSLSLSPQTAR